MPREDNHRYIIGSHIKRKKDKPEWEKIFVTYITDTKLQIKKKNRQPRRKLARDLNRLFTQADSQMVSKRMKKYTTLVIIRKGEIQHHKIVLESSHAPLSENKNGYTILKPISF